MRDEIALLAELVAIPSVSGTEEAIAGFIERTACGWGLDAVRDETSVRIDVRGRAPGPTLAFVSHLDTVPPGASWTRDPFVPTVEGERLYGRGSGDAKASVAAMLFAARDLAAGPAPAAGRLLVILGYGEETRHTSMEQAVGRTGSIDAAIVGEPTNLDIAVAQRGLMMVDLVARGDQRHAGYAGDDGAGGAFTNAALALARDLIRLDRLFDDRAHATLGVASATPTMLEAGVSRNVTPPTARAVLDVRSTPAWTHAELAERMRGALESEVVVTSERLVPCETPAGSRLLAAAERVRPQGRRFGSPTCSDWVFVRHADAVKCGPGTSRRSHTPDEYVDLPEVTEARAFYAAVARAYLEGTG
ncbi:MAG TPA: M20/M25/M40 family metallo-hydrolase [Gemmatimonadales bacterium]|nr:M20/M25/M40 family metallo-hydrolase [Gemmatimonadales bacterium]